MGGLLEDSYGFLSSPPLLGYRSFQDIERPSLGKLPSTRFEFYHEAKRKVSRDGHISVNRSFYSVPPEYLGRDV